MDKDSAFLLNCKNLEWLHYTGFDIVLKDDVCAACNTQKGVFSRRWWSFQFDSSSTSSTASQTKLLCADCTSLFIVKEKEFFLAYNYKMKSDKIKQICNVGHNQ